MELKVYIEGILRKWWLLAFVLILSFLLGRNIGNSQTGQYNASASILLNGPLLAHSAIPSDVAQIQTPASYVAEVAPPNVLNTINIAYPRLTIAQLKTDIVVTTDKYNQVLLIIVTDTSPQTAKDIASYLAQRFVQTQTNDLQYQLTYYQNWLKQTIPQLNNQINQLSTQIQNVTPPPARRGTTTSLNPTTIRMLAADQYQLDIQQRNLLKYQQALNDIHNTQPLFAQDAYVILNPATTSSEPILAPLSTSIYEVLALLIGLCAGIILLIVIEYLHPCVRHAGELQRITGLPILAETPRIPGSEQGRLLQLRFLRFRRYTTSLRLLCALISAPAMKKTGHIVLMTSIRKKRNLALLVASFLAQSGQRTLLIDTNVANSSLHTQLKLTGPANLTSNRGQLLPFVYGTGNPHLFVLSGSLVQHEHITTNQLIALLPELQTLFSIIIVDAAPLHHADTHIWITHVAQTLLLVKKRRDSLRKVKAVYALCEQLKLDTQAILLG